MLDGVAWAAGEIIIFMLASLIIGLAIGWVSGRWLQKGSLARDFDKQLSAERERTRKVESRLNESRSNLDQAQVDIAGGAGERDELESELEGAKAEIAELEGKVAAIADKDAEIERLTAEVAGKGDLENRLAEAAARDEELGQLAEQLESCGNERDRMADQVAQLEAGLSDRDARITELESEVADAAAQLEVAAEPMPEQAEAEAAEPEAVEAEVGELEDVEAEVTEPTKDEAMAQMAEVAARTAGGTPAADDDLKKVHGIGPKLERTLKELGITSFRQIANFTTEDIAVVTAAMDAFKGRIERDDWMSSAAEEHIRKYNEPA